MLHRSTSETPFDHRASSRSSSTWSSSRAAMTSLAENYVGVPFD